MSRTKKNGDDLFEKGQLSPISAKIQSSKDIHTITHNLVTMCQTKLYKYSIAKQILLGIIDLPNYFT